MSTPHHCRYATVGSKSDSEGGFWTDSDIQMWGGVITQKGQQRDLRIVSSLQHGSCLASNRKMTAMSVACWPLHFSTPKLHKN